jgi:hypothetical protein
VSNRQLAEVVSNVLGTAVSPRRATVVTVSHAGNWKALYPILNEKFPRVRLSYGVRCPVVVGAREASYLKKTGTAGAVQFKASARRLLRDDARVLIFDAQKIDCLRSNPGCMSDVVRPGQAAAILFREGVDAAVSEYLAGGQHTLDWQPLTVCPSSVSVVATKLSAAIVREAYEQVAAIVTDAERESLEAMKSELFADIAPEVEDLFLEGSFGAEKLRASAQRKIAVVLLRVTTPSYSTKSGQDPVAFFHEILSEKFIRHDLPVGCVSDVSPNLSFVVKSQRRFSELRLG